MTSKQPQKDGEKEPQSQRVGNHQRVYPLPWENKVLVVVWVNTKRPRKSSCRRTDLDSGKKRNNTMDAKKKTLCWRSNSKKTRFHFSSQGRETEHPKNVV